MLCANSTEFYTLWFLYNCALLAHNICMFIETCLLLNLLKRFRCQLPEDGEIIAPKHVGAM
jgi:hypothetical protein